MTQTLAPTLNLNVSQEFLTGKMETFLTCRAVCSHLKKFSPVKNSAQILEEAALNAIHKTLYTNLQLADMRLLLAELPKILASDYPVVKDIRSDCIKFISQMKDFWRLQNEQMPPYKLWKNWAELDYTLEMLKVLD